MARARNRRHQLVAEPVRYHRRISEYTMTTNIYVARDAPFYLKYMRKEAMRTPDILRITIRIANEDKPHWSYFNPWACNPNTQVLSHGRMRNKIYTACSRLTYPAFTSAAVRWDARYFVWHSGYPLPGMSACHPDHVSNYNEANGALLAAMVRAHYA